MHLPLTIIIPVHNQPAKLKNALRSIAQQIHRPDEVIVVDDGSDEPPSLEPLQLERLNVRVIHHRSNAGAAAARNTGLLAAQNDWVSFLDSDDILEKDTLATRWAAVMGGPAEPDPKEIYGCGWVEVTPDGASLGSRIPRPSRAPADFASGCWFSPGSCIVLNKQSALNAVGGQDESLRRLEDLDWFLALGLRGFRFVVNPILGARIERRRATDPEVIIAMAKRIASKWKQHGLEPALQRRLEAYLWLERSAALRNAGRSVGSATALAMSFSLLPRLSLHLSPGWEFSGRPDDVPHPLRLRPY